MSISRFPPRDGETAIRYRCASWNHRVIAGQPGPADGQVTRGLPTWLLQSMRADGLPAADNPVVLTRLPLGRAVPEPDGLDALILLVLGVMLALLFGCMAFS